MTNASQLLGYSDEYLRSKLQVPLIKRLPPLHPSCVPKRDSLHILHENCTALKLHTDYDYLCNI